MHLHTVKLKQDEFITQFTVHLNPYCTTGERDHDSSQYFAIESDQLTKVDPNWSYRRVSPNIMCLVSLHLLCPQDRSSVANIQGTITQTLYVKSHSMDRIFDFQAHVITKKADNKVY